MRTRLLTLCAALLLVSILWASCGSGSGGPQVGTTEWYWAAAKETFTAGDFEKAQEHLKQVATADGEHKVQAALWRAMLVGGLARGYMEMATALSDAIKENHSLAATFTVRVQDYRRNARRHAIDFVESVGPLRKIVEAQPTTKLEFPFPSGSATESPVLVSLSKGEKISAAQIDGAVDYSLRRGLLFQAAEMAAVNEDIAKAQSLYGAGAVEVPKLVFLQSLGKSLYDLSALFNDKNLNDPKIAKVMLESALQCLGPSLEAEDAQLKQQSEEIKKEIDKQTGRLKV